MQLNIFTRTVIPELFLVVAHFSYSIVVRGPPPSITHDYNDRLRGPYKKRSSKSYNLMDPIFWIGIDNKNLLAFSESHIIIEMALKKKHNAHKSVHT